MPAIPIAVYILIATAVGAFGAPVAVAAYHRFAQYMLTKTGVKIPDDPQVDADILGVTKALAPVLVTELLAGKLNVEEIVATVTKAVLAANPTADTSDLTRHVLNALPAANPQVREFRASFETVPGLTPDIGKK